MSIREDFLRDGYVVLRQILPADLLEAHVQRVDDVYRRHGILSRDDYLGARSRATRNLGFIREVQDLHNDETGLSLTLHWAMREAVSELLGKELIRGYAFTTRWSSEIAPHADDLMVFHGDIQESCRAWCALEDIHPESGMFYVVPGSHRTLRPGVNEEVLEAYPEYRSRLSGLVGNSVDPASLYDVLVPIFNAAYASCARRIEGLPLTTFPIKRGDVILFSFSILHGAFKAHRLSLTRKLLLIDWKTVDCAMYRMEAFWGASHDHRGRCAAMAEPEVQRSPLGLYRVYRPDEHAR